MNIPDNLYYTKDHEWVMIENSIATIGITDYAQKELGDIIFIEFPPIGENYEYGEAMGTIEAVKTVADLFSPIRGSILEVNMKLEDDPTPVNTDPYESGWIIKLTNISNNGSELFASTDYRKFIH